MKAVDITLMINNNPYNVPQKPLKQSKVIIESTPLYPHQINRRHEEMEYKHPSQMMKRSTIPYFLEGSIKEISRIPMSPQPILKGQNLQVSNVSAWQGNKQQANSAYLRELSDRMSIISQRLDIHERKFITLMEMKKQEQSTTLSDSTAHSYEPLNFYTSKQIERSQQSEGSQTQLDLIQKLREEIAATKIEQEKESSLLREDMRLEILAQKNEITKELISNFRESLNEKFVIEQEKINECIQELAKIEEAKLQKAIAEVNREIGNQIASIREQMRNNENREKWGGSGNELKEKVEKIVIAQSEFRSEYVLFKDHVFKSILNAHSQEEELLKLKDKIQTVSSLLQRKQINFYEGYLNISVQRSPYQPLKLHNEIYLTATSKHQSSRLKLSEFTYFIDTEGYLLDSLGHYILNSKNSKIKLQEPQLRKLREAGILK